MKAPLEREMPQALDAFYARLRAAPVVVHAPFSSNLAFSGPKLRTGLPKRNPVSGKPN
jgi:hypothetical protein